MTICCGDSHTSTHGAFGAIAFGIGTSQVRDVLATQCLAMEQAQGPPHRGERPAAPGRVRQGRHPLRSSATLGVQGGVGYAYEYAGDVIDRFSMEERMTVCNMSIEGGARCGYVNPDRTTYDYLRAATFAPDRRGVGARGRRTGTRCAPTPTRAYDDVVRMRGEDIEPVVTWGITPGAVDARRRRPARPATSFADDERPLIDEAYRYMPLEPGKPHPRHADRRRLHRLVHQRAPLGLRRGGAPARGARRPRRAAREGAGRAGLAARARRAGPPRLRPGVPRRRLRVPRGRLLDVPRDEPRQARGRRSSARRRRTATSRAGRARRPAARC